MMLVAAHLAPILRQGRPPDVEAMGAAGVIEDEHVRAGLKPGRA